MSIAMNDELLLKVKTQLIKEKTSRKILEDKINNLVYGLETFCEQRMLEEVREELYGDEIADEYTRNL